MLIIMQFLWSGCTFHRSSLCRDSKMPKQCTQRKKTPSKCTAKWCLDLFKLCNYSSNSECVLMTQSCILWLCWFKWPCLPMSDSAPTYILTNKKHWVFPCKFQPLVSVHFTVILKTKTEPPTSFPPRGTQNVSRWLEVQTHLINFVPNQHFYDVVTCCVGFQFVQPVFKLSESVALRHIIHCQNNTSREYELKDLSVFYELGILSVQFHANLHTVKNKRCWLAVWAFSKDTFSSNKIINSNVWLVKFQANDKQWVSNSVSVKQEESCIKKAL